MASLGIGTVAVGQASAASASQARRSTRSANRAAPTAHSAFVCPKVALIGARGSGEAASSKHGFGPVIGQLETDVREDLSHSNVPLKPIAVLGEYTADSVDDLIPSLEELAALRAAPPAALPVVLLKWKQNHLDRFLASIGRGVTSVLSSVRAENAQCGSTPIVLAGYSQGAMAVHQAELQMTRSERASIAATVLVADGDRVSRTAAYKLGSAPPRSEGIRRYLRMIPDRDVPMPSSTVDVCNDHDFVCDFTSGALPRAFADVKVHLHSYDNGLLSRAASWAAGKVLARLAKSTPTPTPTPGPPTIITVPDPVPPVTNSGSINALASTTGPAGLAIPITIPGNCPEGDQVYAYADGQEFEEIQWGQYWDYAPFYTAPNNGNSPLSVGTHQISFACQDSAGDALWSEPGFSVQITGPQLATSVAQTTTSPGDNFVDYAGAPSGPEPCPGIQDQTLDGVDVEYADDPYDDFGGFQPAPGDTSESFPTPQLGPGQYVIDAVCGYNYTLNYTSGDWYFFGDTTITVN